MDSLRGKMDRMRTTWETADMIQCLREEMVFVETQMQDLLLLR